MLTNTALTKIAAPTRVVALKNRALTYDGADEYCTDTDCCADVDSADEGWADKVRADEKCAEKKPT